MLRESIRWCRHVGSRLTEEYAEMRRLNSFRSLLPSQEGSKSLRCGIGKARRGGPGKRAAEAARLHIDEVVFQGNGVILGRDGGLDRLDAPGHCGFERGKTFRYAGGSSGRFNAGGFGPGTLFLRVASH